MKRILTIAVVSVMACSAMGAIIVETFEDSNGTFAQGGNNHGTFTQTDDIESTGYNGVEITALQDPGPNMDTFLTSDASFTGDFTSLGGSGVLGVSFDFYVDSANTDPDLPSQLFVYFTGTSGNIWRWDILDTQSLVSDDWTRVGANFDLTTYATEFGSWDRVGGTASDVDWLTDIASVSTIGIQLGYQAGAPLSEIYGLDNFALLDENFLVPEPETYLVLGMALLSMVVVFRKRISESLAEVHATLMA